MVTFLSYKSHNVRDLLKQRSYIIHTAQVRIFSGVLKCYTLLREIQVSSTDLQLQSLIVRIRSHSHQLCPLSRRYRWKTWDQSLCCTVHPLYWGHSRSDTLHIHCCWSLNTWDSFQLHRTFLQRKQHCKLLFSFAFSLSLSLSVSNAFWLVCIQGRQ